VAGLELNFADEVCVEALSDERLLAAMARFEAALAGASAQVGLVPQAAAELIAKVCAQGGFDAAALARQARDAGALTIPFVKELTARVAKVSPDAARYVHLGATSQDVLDTALVLCARQAMQRIAELAFRLGDAAAELARRHARTPCAARTLLQPAVPVTFGWKAAVWLSMLARCTAAFAHARDAALVLQFGGAGGTLSAFGDQALAIEAALGKQLDLQAPAAPWHSARDGLARLAAEAALLAGAAGKIGRDVALLMQPEIGEAAEPPAGGRGASSAMPHKHNPAVSMLALEAAQRAPGLVATFLVQMTPEHERGLGQWQSQFLTLRELLAASASGLAAMVTVLEGLEVNADRMRSNLERSRGLVYSEAVSMRLARSLGKAAAHSLVGELSAQVAKGQGTLLEALRADPQVAGAIPESELARLFAPQDNLGASQEMIERALQAWSAVRLSARGTSP
jgi:3-carboxy-cis,cis-muconate cycloisomerase